MAQAGQARGAGRSSLPRPLPGCRAWNMASPRWAPAPSSQGSRLVPYYGRTYHHCQEAQKDVRSCVAS